MFWSSLRRCQVVLSFLRSLCCIFVSLLVFVFVFEFFLRLCQGAALLRKNRHHDALDTYNEGVLSCMSCHTLTLNLTLYLNPDEPFDLPILSEQFRFLQHFCIIADSSS